MLHVLIASLYFVGGASGIATNFSCVAEVKSFESSYEQLVDTCYGAVTPNWIEFTTKDATKGSFDGYFGGKLFYGRSVVISKMETNGPALTIEGKYVTGDV